MIGFDDVVQILDLSVSRLLRAPALPLQLDEGGDVGRRNVGRS